MISSEDKRAFLESVLPMAAIPSKSDEAQEKLYDFVLKFTNDGKFYKYRTFDEKGHSIDNLKTGTLYCSQPSKFNDPFDFKIGTTVTSAIEAKYGDEFNIIAEFLEKYIKYKNGILGLESCSEREKVLIDTLSKSEKFNIFLENAYCFCDSEKAVADYLIQNKNALYEFLSIIVNEPQIENELKVTEKMLPKIHKILSKDNNISSDNSVLDFAFLRWADYDLDEIDFIINSFKMYYPEREASAEKAEQMLNLAKNTFEKELNETFKIGCLATSPKSRLMWSHYADGHKGFCIEYDFKNAPKSLLPLPVIYSRKRPLFPWKIVLDQSAETKTRCLLEIIIGLLTKDKEWEYENEWRLLLGPSEDSNIKIPISAVYLGLEINEENKNTVIEICNQNNIPVKQMVIDRGQYELHIDNHI